LPTVATPAPRFAHFDASETIWTEMRTIPFNLSGHPAISVPVGEIDTLPMGLQIVGRKKDDATVLRVASVFEASTDHCITAPLQHKQWLPI
ncbi:MAG: amidase family protein, partial [Sulfitobacter sp.]